MDVSNPNVKLHPYKPDLTPSFDSMEYKKLPTDKNLKKKKDFENGKCTNYRWKLIPKKKYLWHSTRDCCNLQIRNGINNLTSFKNLITQLAYDAFFCVLPVEVVFKPCVFCVLSQLEF